MFVKFLETESTPQSAPLPLPVDKMVVEERLKAEQHHRAAFNPFVAPAGVASSTPNRSSTHPLLVGECNLGPRHPHCKDTVLDIGAFSVSGE